jgi:hypothetical protein
MQPEPVPAPEPPGPSSSDGGPIGYVYRCERCGDHVIMTRADYDQLLAHQRRLNRRPRRWGAQVLCDDCTPAPPAPPPLHQSQVTAAHVQPPRHLPASGSRFNLTPAERMDYGVTVTIHNERLALYDSLVGVGPVVVALTGICDRIDDLNDDEPGWQIVSVSTPGTIYADLQGMRDPAHPRPEVRLLAVIGRIDLLEPGHRPWPTS